MTNPSPPGLTPPGGNEGVKIRLVAPALDEAAEREHLRNAQWAVITKTLERILGQTELFDVLVSELARVLEPEMTGDQATRPSNELFRLPGMVYRSAVMRDLAEQIHRIRESRMAVLITGESGTGKEGVARALHTLSPWHEGPFVAFNCTMVTRDLISSQLFGHRKGSFTGANTNYHGSIRSAEGGTIFLDEIGDLPIELQPKLLRFVQEGEVHPVGETRPVKVNVRVIAATNRDIEAMVARGDFREDLYYRINVLRFHMPPLRDRREEIPLLANHLLERFMEEAGKRALSFSPTALAALTSAEWPGNIRQLANEIQRAIAMVNTGEVIKPFHLSPVLIGKKSGKSDWVGEILAGSAEPAGPAVTSRAPGNPLADVQTPPQEDAGKTLANDVVELERHRILQALERADFNLSRTARDLGLTRRGLYLKMARYDIDPKSLKKAKAPDEGPA